MDSLMKRLERDLRDVGRRYVAERDRSDHDKDQQTYLRGEPDLAGICGSVANATTQTQRCFGA